MTHLRLLTLSIVATTLSAAGCAGTGPPKRPTIDDRFLTLEVPEDLKAGEERFNLRCSECHGERGTGTRQGPAFVDPVYASSRHADLAFTSAAMRGVRAHHWRFGDMRPVEGITEDELAQIVPYIRWLQQAAGIE